jgi:hypothetical protein
LNEQVHPADEKASSTGKISAKNPTAIGGVVKVGNHPYGTTGAAIIFLGLKIGKVFWRKRALGPSSLLSANHGIYLHGENGDVALVEPSPEGYRQKGRFPPPEQPRHIRGQMEKSWAYLELANGRLYIRDHQMLGVTKSKHNRSEAKGSKKFSPQDLKGAPGGRRAVSERRSHLNGLAIA